MDSFFSVLIISGNDYVLESNMQAGYFIRHKRNLNCSLVDQETAETLSISRQQVIIRTLQQSRQVQKN